MASALVGVSLLPASSFWRNPFAVLLFLRLSYFSHFLLYRVAGLICEIPSGDQVDGPPLVAHAEIQARRVTTRRSSSGTFDGLLRFRF